MGSGASSGTGRSSPARLAVGIGVILAIWSFNFIVGKIGLRELPPVALASLRIFVSGLAMLPILLLSVLAERRRSREAAGTQVVPPRRWSREDFRRFAVLGFLGWVVNNGCFTVGLAYTSVGHSSLIIAMAPILVLLLAWMGGMEHITRRSAVGLALAFAGAVILGGEAGANPQAGRTGDLLTAFGVLGFSVYTVLAKRAASHYPTVHLNAYSNFFAAAIVLPVVVWQLVRIERTEGLASVGWQGWVAVLYMGVLASAVCFWLYFWALRSMAASQLASLNYLQPFFATILGVMLLGENLTSYFIAGGALVITGVYVIQSRRAPAS